MGNAAPATAHRNAKPAKKEGSHMGPRRRARSGGGSWVLPAGQKKRPGPDGAPGQGFRQRFAGNKGAREGSLWLG